MCRSRETARDRRAGFVGRARSADYRLIVRTAPASVRLRRLTKVGAPHVGDADRDHVVIGDAVGRPERDALDRTEQMPVLAVPNRSERGSVFKLAWSDDSGMVCCRWRDGRKYQRTNSGCSPRNTLTHTLPPRRGTPTHAVFLVFIRMGHQFDQIMREARHAGVKEKRAYRQCVDSRQNRG